MNTYIQKNNSVADNKKNQKKNFFPIENFSFTEIKNNALPRNKEKTLQKKRTAVKILLFFSVFLTSAYLLLHPSTAFNAVFDALLFCVKTLVPALFPFMIAGEIIILSGFPMICEKIFGKLFYRVFGISGKGASAFIVGAFCGFPVGAKTAVSLYESGEIEKKDAEKLSGICNNGGIGFIISGIGAGIWQNPRFGILLYLSQILSAVITGFFLFGMNKKEKSVPLRSDAKDTSEKNFNLSEVLSKAISTSVLSILKVIGFVVFFELILTVLSEILLLAGANSYIVSLICTVTEISSGAKSLHNLSFLNPSSSNMAKILTFSLCAWGGFSVFMQFCAFAYPSGIGTKKYLKSKFVQSIVCTLIGTVLVLLKVV